MSRATGPRIDPMEHARKLQAAKERARLLKEQRAGSGTIEPSHTHAHSGYSGVSGPPGGYGGAAAPGYAPMAMDAGGRSNGFGGGDEYAPSSAGPYGGRAASGGLPHTYGNGHGTAGPWVPMGGGDAPPDPYGGPGPRSDPWAGAAPARASTGPYGPGAHSHAPVDAPSSGSGRPGYRQMMTFGDAPAPADSRPTHAAASIRPSPYGPPGGSLPAATDAYGPTARGSGAPAENEYASHAPAVSQAEADEAFYGLLRSDEPKRGGAKAAPSSARVAGGARRPAWNSDYASSADDVGPSEASRRPAIEDDGGHQVSSNKARVLRMRQELQSTEVPAAVSKAYAGIVPERPREGSGAPPRPAASGAPSWDDMPVGGARNRQADALPFEMEDDTPVVTTRASAPAPGRTGGASGPYSRYGSRDLDAPSESLDVSAPPASTAGSGGPPKLALLKSKLRSGSARALSTRTLTSQYNTNDGIDTMSSYPTSASAVDYDDALPSAPSHRASGKSLAHSPPSARYGVTDGRVPSRGTGSGGPAVKRSPMMGAPRSGEDAPAVARGAGYPPSGGLPDEAEAPADAGDLIECGGCGRRFNEQALAKHEKVCAKVFQTKRAVFDSKAHALPEEAKKLAGKGAGKSKRTAAAVEPAGGKTAWESKSRQLREAMKAARQYAAAVASGKSGADLPPPPPSDPDPDLVPCPHCGRSFSEKAAERHIPKCSSIVAKPTMLRRGAGVAAGAAGAQKMNATVSTRSSLGSTAGSAGSRVSSGANTTFASTSSGGMRGVPSAPRSYDDVPVGGGRAAPRYEDDFVDSRAVLGKHASRPAATNASNAVPRPPSGTGRVSMGGAAARGSSGYGQYAPAATRAPAGTSASGESYFSAAELLRGADAADRRPALPRSGSGSGRQSLGGMGYSGGSRESADFSYPSALSGSGRPAPPPRAGGIAYRM